VIPGLDATYSGPIAKDREGTERLVHLHQGHLDGACGPYAVLMGLLTLSLVKRGDVTAWGAVEKRTNVGTLIARMSEGGSPLFKEGIDLTDLTNLVGGKFGTGLQVIPFSLSGAACRHVVDRWQGWSALDSAMAIVPRPGRKGQPAPLRPGT
jgi:hypothetical protein